MTFVSLRTYLLPTYISIHLLAYSLANLPSNLLDLRGRLLSQRRRRERREERREKREARSEKGSFPQDCMIEKNFTV